MQGRLQGQRHILRANKLAPRHHTHTAVHIADQLQIHLRPATERVLLLGLHTGNADLLIAGVASQFVGRQPLGTDRSSPPDDVRGQVGLRIQPRVTALGDDGLERLKPLGLAAELLIADIGHRHKPIGRLVLIFAFDLVGGLAGDLAQHGQHGLLIGVAGNVAALHAQRRDLAGLGGQTAIGKVDGTARLCHPTSNKQAAGVEASQNCIAVPDHLPPVGRVVLDEAKRAGGLERLEHPAVPGSDERSNGLGALLDEAADAQRGADGRRNGARLFIGLLNGAGVAKPRLRRRVE